MTYRFFDLEEAANYTGQSQQEILYRINTDQLPAIFEHATGVYRISERDLEPLKKTKT